MGRSMLLLVSGFVVIFGIIQQSSHNRQQVLQQRAPEYYYQEQSRYISGAMMEIALGNLNNGTNYLTPNSIDNTEISMLGGIGTITVDSTTNFQSRVHATIAGTFEKPDGTTIYTEIKAKFVRDAFSIYSYFTDVEPTIWFVTGDELNGPVHTNGKFHIDGDPVFNGPITSHDGVKKRGDSDPEYNGGSDFNAKKIPLPEGAPEVVKLAKTENGGIGQFNQEITVEFFKNPSSLGQSNGNGNRNGNGNNNANGLNKNNDGRVKITLADGTVHKYKIAEFNGVISSTKNVKVKGTVDGQVTVHSQKDVEIMGDLVYENRNYDDKSQTISDDRLGLISEGDTIVDNDAHEDDSYGNNSNQDVYIDASILALGKSFQVEGYDDGDSRGTLNILGGLIQRERGTVGLVSGSGYLKNYSYDTRFSTGSTPGFPRKKKFDVETWRESTQIIKQD